MSRELALRTTRSVGQSGRRAGIDTGLGTEPGEPAAVPRGDLPGAGAVRAGLGHEDGLPVVAQLLDALLDVGERAVVAALGRSREVGPRVPPAGELLDR